LGEVRRISLPHTSVNRDFKRAEDRSPALRIEYLEGEPEKMTRAELDVLESRNLLGEVRLSCQALCDHYVKVRVLMTVESTGLDGPGPHPESHITPDPEWVDKPA
jgi:hypothetical protein